MPILITTLFISLVQLLLLSYTGLGVARLLLPQRLYAYDMLLAPHMGLALIAIIGYYGANAGFTMRQILPIILILASIILVVALATSPPGSRRWLPGLPPMREFFPLLILLIATWLLQIAPILSYGTLIPIGDNWDVEFYLPLADYLKDYSYPTLHHAPANPLRDLLLTPRLASRAMGATYAQALADIVTFRDAWDSWVPMLAVIRTITLAGLYPLLREGLGARPAAALAGVALAGIQSLLLWTTYNSFGMGLGGLALLPAALLCVLLALQHNTWRTIAAAALLLGGLTCTYWPMLMAYGAAGLGIGLAVMWQHRQSDWVYVIGRGLAVLIGGSILGLLVHMRASTAFVEMFLAQTPSMGVDEFLSPAAIIGSTPFSHRGLVPATPLDQVARWGGLIAALFLLIHALVRGVAQRGIALGMVICLVAYLLGLRFVVGYPYGLLRGTSYVNTLLVGIIGTGAFALLPHRIFRRSPPPQPHSLDRREASECSSPSPSVENGAGEGMERQSASPLSTGKNPIHERFASSISVISLGMFLVLLLSSGLAAYQTYQVYADQPGVYGLESVGIRTTVANLDPQATVFISPAPELRGPYTAVWAYALRRHTLTGGMATGFHPLVNMPPQSTPDYVLLQHNEDPRTYGVSADGIRWQDARAILYEAPAERVAWLNGRPSALTEGSLVLNNTTYTRAQIGVGSIHETTPDAPLLLHASSTTLSFTPTTATEPAQRTLNLALGSFVEQHVEIDTGAVQHTLALSDGASLVHNIPIDAPITVSLRGDQAPLFVRWASLNLPQGSATTPISSLLSDTVVLGIQSQPHATGMQSTMQIANPGHHVLRIAVEIYEEVAGYHTTPAHYAWALFPAPLAGSHQIDLDVQTPSVTFNDTPISIQTGDMRDGHYFVALWVYQGEHVLGMLPCMRFERRNGQIVQPVAPLDINSAFVRMMEPANKQSVQFGTGITLRGFEIDADSIKAGDDSQVSLEWQAHTAQPPSPYLVFVQVLDEQDRKIAEWNGAAGGDWHPTPAWQPGQRIWQDIPLTIAADAAPGTYRVIIGLFDATSGERLPIGDGNTMFQIGEIEIESR